MTNKCKYIRLLSPMKKLLNYLYILTFFSTCLFFNLAKADNTNNICQNKLIEATFELEKSWIFICNENEEKTLIKLNKTKEQELANLPAFGTFPTYAALEGEISDPNSKIYNISPFDFKIIQASIIKKIDPVINTLHQDTGTQLMILSGEKEQEAIAVCEKKKPVQVFETEAENIYICIEAEENDINSINLNYVQKSKNNSYPLINLPANLTSSISYETSANQGRRYSISYQGLEIYENGTKLVAKPVINLYLARPDMTKEDNH